MQHTKVSRLMLLPIAALTLMLVSLFQVSGMAEASAHLHMQGIGQPPVVNPRFLMALPHHSITPIQPNPAPISNPDKKHKPCIGQEQQYMYYENGTDPDTIDVYQACPPYLRVGTYPTDAYNGAGAYYGANRLTVSEKDKTHGDCLILADTDDFAGTGFFDSFAIRKDGSLSPELSHIGDPSGGHPSNLADNGDVLYAMDDANTVLSISVGASCTLNILSTTAAHNGAFYINFALVGSTELVAPDLNSGNIDVYTLGQDGAVTYLASTAGQIDLPDGVAVQTAKQVNNVFTGSADGQTATAQGGQLDPTSGALAFLKGSPASDSNGVNGITLAFDSKDNLLIEGEMLSASLGVYRVKAGVPGTPGSISFLEQTLLAQSGSAPQVFGQLGKTLLVDGGYNGDVEACTLSGKGVSGCTTILVLTDPSGFSSGIAFC